MPGDRVPRAIHESRSLPSARSARTSDQRRRSAARACAGPAGGATRGSALFPHKYAPINATTFLIYGPGEAGVT